MLHAPASDILSQDETAQLLRLSAKTLANWRARARGPRYVKMGGVILYRRADLDAYLEASVVEPALHTPRRLRRQRRENP